MREQQVNPRKQSQASTVATATKLALLLAVLSGCSFAVAAAPEVCVLAPHLDPALTSPQGVPKAVVPISQPTLFIKEPLAELRLERGAEQLWSWQPPPDGSALEGPLAWPLSPLLPGQTVTVRLRPVSAAPDHFASIQLVGGSAQRLREGDRLLQSLARDPWAWRSAIEALLAKGDASLATALLFANAGPNDPDLNALRLLVARQSCQ